MKEKICFLNIQSVKIKKNAICYLFMLFEIKKKIPLDPILKHNEIINPLR